MKIIFSFQQAVRKAQKFKAFGTFITMTTYSADFVKSYFALPSPGKISYWLHLRLDSLVLKYSSSTELYVRL